LFCLREVIVLLSISQRVIIYADVKRTLTGDPDLLRDVVAPVGEGEPGAHIIDLPCRVRAP
jgi:hypothetical protein